MREYPKALYLHGQVGELDPFGVSPNEIVVNDAEEESDARGAGYMGLMEYVTEVTPAQPEDAPAKRKPGRPRKEQ